MIVECLCECECLYRGTRAALQAEEASCWTASVSRSAEQRCREEARAFIANLRVGLEEKKEDRMTQFVQVS